MKSSILIDKCIRFDWWYYWVHYQIFCDKFCNSGEVLVNWCDVTLLDYLFKQYLLRNEDTTSFPSVKWCLAKTILLQFGEILLYIRYEGFCTREKPEFMIFCKTLAFSL